jgi:hypothetical protein
MKSSMSQLNIPTEVIRILASHGPVQVSTHAYEGANSATGAPFEDVFHLFFPTGSPTIGALLKSTQVEVSAKAADGRYQIRMKGRAHAGRCLAGHPMLSVLEPWQPEGVSPRQLVVVPFVAEHIEFIRGDADHHQRNAGLTPAGRERPSISRIWFMAAFSGMAGPLALWFVLASAFWFGLQGAEFLGRPMGLICALLAGLGLISGTRLLVISQGFLQWRNLRASRGDAPFLSEGFVSPHEARLVAATSLSVAAIALFAIWAVWGEDLVWRVVLGSGIWLCGPAWALHLAMGRPEPRR